VGRRLLPALRDAGWRVRCLVHNRAIPDADEVVVGDLNNHAALARAVLGTDAVLHLGAVTHSRRSRLYHVVNVEGTRLLAEAARQQGVARFVHVSSRAISPEGGVYSRSKLAAEEALKLTGLEYVIVRLPELYGFGGAEGVDDIRARAAAGRTIFVVGHGAQTVCPVHVDDVIEPLARALDVQDAAGKTYTLAGECFSVRRLAERCSAAADRRGRVIGVPEAIVVGLSHAARLLPLRLYPDQLDRLTAPKPPLSPNARADLGFSPRSFEDDLAAH
jgi:UDP-glucose 4-epimerase